MGSGGVPWWVGVWEVMALVVLLFAPMWVGGSIAERRRRSRLLGVASGFVLSWIGVVLLWKLLPTGLGKGDRHSSAEQS